MGGIVRVCPGGGLGPDGSYQEEVTINKNLTLMGATLGTANQAVILAPDPLVANAVSLFSGAALAAQIFVASGVTANISNVVVDGGTAWKDNSPYLEGILYQNASGLVNHVVTRNQTAIPPGGSGFGFGIFVQSSPDGSGISKVTVENSSVHDFEKNGITGNEPGTTLTLINNQVRGLGPITEVGQNGIQFGLGATGTATNNTVSNVIYAPCVSVADCTASASGILVWGAANVTVTGNRVTNTQGGIEVQPNDPTSGTANNAKIASNVVDGTLVEDGIDVCGSTGGSITGNRVAGSSQAGIHLDGSCTWSPSSGGITVSSNIINEACAGYEDNTTSPNTVSFALASTTNVINTTVTGTDTCSPSQQSQEVPAGSGQGSSRLQPAEL